MMGCGHEDGHLCVFVGNMAKTGRRLRGQFGTKKNQRLQAIPGAV